jgi:hypothetical protein
MPGRARKIYIIVSEIMLPGVKFTILTICFILVCPFICDPNWLSECSEVNVGGCSS